MEKYIIKNLKKFFRLNIILKFIKYYNLLVLTIFTFGCLIYLLDYSIYINIYNIIISLFGFNLASLVYVGYVTFKLNFCKWQIFAYIFNLIVCLIYIILKMLSYFFIIKYDIFIITILSCIFLVYTLKLFINGK